MENKNSITTQNLIEFFIEANKLRKVERYSILPKKLRNNVAEHSFMMIILADMLIKHFDLKLDFQKVVRYIWLHDWGEIGGKKDVCAPLVTDRKTKKANEKIVAHNFFNKYGMTDLITDYDKFNTWEEEEAKFVNLLDKLEAQIFNTSNGLKNYVDKDFEFDYHYSEKAAELYPLLNDFVNDVKSTMKKRRNENK